MPAHFHRPAPPLDAFVDCLWQWHGYTAPELRERALPSGTLDVIINLRDDALRVVPRDTPHTPHTPLTFPGAMISGAHADYFVIETPPHAHVMGVHFKPGGAYPFLGVPAGDLEGTHAPLDALWGTFAHTLRARLLEAPTHTERFRVLEHALLSRAKSPLQPMPVLTEALRAFNDRALTSVAAVNARTGLSAKQLIALFRDRVGLGPKAFWRVRRFQAALREWEHAHTQGASLAAAFGYCDQSHWIREFHAFTGLSPRAYLDAGVERPNHVPLRG